MGTGQLLSSCAGDPPSRQDAALRVLGHDRPNHWDRLVSMLAGVKRNGLSLSCLQAPKEGSRVGL
jgi:hypothetical protein